MIYIDLVFNIDPTEIRGVEIHTGSLDCAVRRMQDWLHGYSYAAQHGAPEIDRIARTKSRGVEYIKIEDMK